MFLDAVCSNCLFQPSHCARHPFRGPLRGVVSRFEATRVKLKYVGSFLASRLSSNMATSMLLVSEVIVPDEHPVGMCQLPPVGPKEFPNPIQFNPIFHDVLAETGASLAHFRLVILYFGSRKLNRKSIVALQSSSLSAEAKSPATE